MSGPQPGEIEEAELYLRMLTARAPKGCLLDIRYRTREGDFARLFLHAKDGSAARRIARMGQYTDVYVGCAPRVRRRGSKADLAPTALLWADCDGEAALEAVEAFSPRASMIVASGGWRRAHAYWSLTEALGVEELEQANRRLAERLGADVKCADATRILRVPGTWNHKYERPMPVEIIRHAEGRYAPSEILDVLPQLDLADRARRNERQPKYGPDPLRQIEPAHYVRLLAGLTPDREGKVACPFHEDGTPSLHVYPTVEQGWTCYGCPTPDGKPPGGDIYTFASKLWRIPSYGRSFLDLQARLDEVFAIERAAELGVVLAGRAPDSTSAIDR